MRRAATLLFLNTPVQTCRVRDHPEHHGGGPHFSSWRLLPGDADLLWIISRMEPGWLYSFSSFSGSKVASVMSVNGLVTYVSHSESLRLKQQNDSAQEAQRSFVWYIIPIYHLSCLSSAITDTFLICLEPFIPKTPVCVFLEGGFNFEVFKS